MKLGVIGLPQSGKTTIFETLTGIADDDRKKNESRIGVVKVPDHRIDILSEIYKPAKTTYAQVKYFLPGRTEEKKQLVNWSQTRDCDAFIEVIGNFRAYGLKDPNPRRDFHYLEQEMILDDLAVVEKRLETIQKYRGQKTGREEPALLEQCLKILESEAPLRKFPEVARNPVLKGFTFLSAKPLLILFNNDEDDEGPPEIGGSDNREKRAVVRGKLERELSALPPEEADEFLADYKIDSPAMDRVIKESYKLLGLTSFFTAGDPEVRAWTIKENSEATEAAEAIHSDIKKGFIKAEVLAFDDLMKSGKNYQQAKKNGLVRLEGKTYKVKNGDIILFRFNV